MIITQKCQKCERCVDECPVNAINLNKGDVQARINKSVCVQCGYCMTVCPFDAIEED